VTAWYAKEREKDMFSMKYEPSYDMIISEKNFLEVSRHMTKPQELFGTLTHTAHMKTPTKRQKTVKGFVCVSKSFDMTFFVNDGPA
jgi:hypothetical protein